MTKILFVCLGNICRSPMAEGLLKKMIKDQNLEHCFHVESRGTSSWEEGNPPHPGTQKILKRLGISTEGMFSKKITKNDFNDFDYIIGMDHENMKYLKKYAFENIYKLYLLRDVDAKTKGEIVPDPYYSGKYEETYQLLNESLSIWLEKLINENVC
jgi:protein-tyrosine phosphatase